MLPECQQCIELRNQLDAQTARLAAGEVALGRYRTALETLILDAYPCARPTCQAEQCVLGRQIQAQAVQLAAARHALVVLYELNESGNVGGAIYEEAMDLAMNVLRDTETAAGAVGAGEACDGA